MVWEKNMFKFTERSISLNLITHPSSPLLQAIIPTLVKEFILSYLIQLIFNRSVAKIVTINEIAITIKALIVS